MWVGQITNRSCRGETNGHQFLCGSNEGVDRWKFKRGTGLQRQHKFRQSCTPLGQQVLDSSSSPPRNPQGRQRDSRKDTPLHRRHRCLASYSSWSRLVQGRSSSLPHSQEGVDRGSRRGTSPQVEHKYQLSCIPLGPLVQGSYASPEPGSH